MMTAEYPTDRDWELYQKYKEEWFTWDDEDWPTLRSDAPQYVKDFFSKFWGETQRNK